jgi:molybdopterin molybdotransferase
VEDTRRADAGTVAILEAAQTGQHVRRAGEDVPKGTDVLRIGTFLRAAEIAMLATMGRAAVPTFRPARVAVVTTGDEVVEIEEGVAPPPGKIRNSNRYALAALVREAGAVVHSLTHIPDELEATRAALRACADPQTGADLIVTAGGVSVGDRDFVRPALEELGTLELWRVAMKPGKPLAFGSIGDTLFFGLPGNPVSAMVTFELFVRPALWKMAGRADAELARRQVPARLLEPIAHVPGRREYVRAVTTVQDGQFLTRPTGAQDSGILRSMTLANSLFIIPEEAAGVAAGETVTALLLD